MYDVSAIKTGAADVMPMPHGSHASAVKRAQITRITPHGAAATERLIINETAVAIVLNGTTVAVMMISPRDIEDFACGFAITEG